MGKIIVVGSANADLVVNIERRPVGGETITGSDLTVTPGGKGANQAAAAAKLGGDVWFLGCVGNDDHGDLLCRTLEGAGVHLAGLARAETPTGSAIVMITPDGENSIIVAPGANRLVTPETLRDAEPFWADASLVVMQSRFRWRAWVEEASRRIVEHDGGRAPRSLSATCQR